MLLLCCCCPCPMFAPRPWLTLAWRRLCPLVMSVTRSDVTACDINVMFKLIRGITCTISHDFLAVYNQNPSVLVQPQQRWNSALRAGLSLAELRQGPPANFYLSKPPKLGRNYRGTIKTSDRGPVVVVRGWSSLFSVVVGSLWVVGAVFHGFWNCMWLNHTNQQNPGTCVMGMR